MAGHVWARVTVGAAAVWAGVRAALWFPGRVALRLGARCGTRFSFCSVLAALVFSSRPSHCVDHPGRLRVCLCVGGDPLGTQGSLSHLPRRRHCLWLPTPGGDSGAVVRPQGREPGGPSGCDPQRPGGGAAARRSSLCCLGLCASPSLLTRAQSVRLGVGMSQRRSPLASHGNLWVEMRTITPPPVELRELWGC